VTDCGLTDVVKGDKKKLELWSLDKSEVYTLQVCDVLVSSSVTCCMTTWFLYSSLCAVTICAQIPLSRFYTNHLSVKLVAD